MGTVFFTAAASTTDLGGAFGIAAWAVAGLGVLAGIASVLLPRARPAVATAPIVQATTREPTVVEGKGHAREEPAHAPRSDPSTAAGHIE